MMRRYKLSHYQKYARRVLAFDTGSSDVAMKQLQSLDAITNFFTISTRGDKERFETTVFGNDSNAAAKFNALQTFLVSSRNEKIKRYADIVLGLKVMPRDFNLQLKSLSEDDLRLLSANLYIRSKGVSVDSKAVQEHYDAEVKKKSEERLAIERAEGQKTRAKMLWLGSTDAVRSGAAVVSISAFAGLHSLREAMVHGTSATAYSLAISTALGVVFFVGEAFYHTLQFYFKKKANPDMKTVALQQERKKVWQKIGVSGAGVVGGTAGFHLAAFAAMKVAGAASLMASGPIGITIAIVCAILGNVMFRWVTQRCQNVADPDDADAFARDLLVEGAFATLGLEPKAETLDDWLAVKRAYRLKVFKHHPDKVLLREAERKRRPAGLVEEEDQDLATNDTEEFHNAFRAYKILHEHFQTILRGKETTDDFVIKEQQSTDGTCVTLMLPGGFNLSTDRETEAQFKQIQIDEKIARIVGQEVAKAKLKEFCCLRDGMVMRTHFEFVGKEHCGQQGIVDILAELLVRENVLRSTIVESVKPSQYLSQAKAIQCIDEAKGKVLLLCDAHTLLEKSEDAQQALAEFAAIIGRNTDQGGATADPIVIICCRCDADADDIKAAIQPSSGSVLPQQLTRFEFVDFDSDEISRVFIQELRRLQRPYTDSVTPESVEMLIEKYTSVNQRSLYNGLLSRWLAHKTKRAAEKRYQDDDVTNLDYSEQLCARAIQLVDVETGLQLLVEELNQGDILLSDTGSDVSSCDIPQSSEDESVVRDESTFE